MDETNQFVVFKLEEQSYCLYLSVVERVVQAAETAAVPKAPEIVTGILNVNGRIIPALNIRKRFRLPEKEIGPDDQFIIAHTSKRTVAILVDEVTGVISFPTEAIVTPGSILPAPDYLAGVIKLPGGMILIHDLDTFLSLEEEKALDSSIPEGRSGT